MYETPQTISSPQTFIVKFLLPYFWILGFGFGTWLVWSGALVGKHGSPAPEAVKYAFLALWIGVALALYRQTEKLKRVRMDETSLYVSDFRHEEQIPFGQIEGVGPDNWRGNKQVVVRLRAPCAFGEEIVFIPPKQFAFWRAPPIVAELKRRVVQNQHAQPGLLRSKRQGEPE
jgi:hypothetical protein